MVAGVTTDGEFVMPEIARLKITLKGVKPTVMRRLEVPLSIRLDQLHEVIQIAMGWENYHLFEFWVGGVREGISWGIPDPDYDFGREQRSAAKARLSDLLPEIDNKAKTFTYLYDFGDDWEHTIKVEAIAEADLEILYPRLIAAKGACPPEDVGGVWGYAEYLEILADPTHERHKEMIEWGGEDFDPTHVDEARIRRHLETFAKGIAPRRKKALPKSS
jgi:hypothetical protein